MNALRLSRKTHRLLAALGTEEPIDATIKRDGYWLEIRITPDVECIPYESYAFPLRSEQDENDALRGIADLAHASWSVVNWYIAAVFCKVVREVYDSIRHDEKYGRQHEGKR